MVFSESCGISYYYLVALVMFGNVKGLLALRNIEGAIHHNCGFLVGKYGGVFVFASFVLVLLP